MTARDLSTRRRSRSLAAAVVAGATLLTGCSGSSGSAPPASGPAAGAVLAVIASTNVWASVARAVGGDDVSVTSILDDPNADPHSFEATPKIKLDMSDAALVIVNGGGYDDWATSTAESLSPAPHLINAVEASGVNTSGEFNEHVFYDLAAVTKVADAIAAELGTEEPSAASSFTANAAAFDTQVGQLRTQAAAIGAAHPGIQVVATEPVAGYLIQAMGFQDITPAGFSSAIEAETEVSVKDLDDTKNLLSSKQVQLLFNNIQTTGAVTDQLLAAATAAGVPVIGVTETLPAGTTEYLTWMRGNLSAVSDALR